MKNKIVLILLNHKRAIYEGERLIKEGNLIIRLNLSNFDTLLPFKFVRKFLSICKRNQCCKLA